MGAQLRHSVRAIGRVPAAVWWVTALLGLLLALWSTLAPLGRAPDEPVHADLVDHIARGGSYPDFDGRRTSTAMISAFLDHVPGLNGHWLTPESAPPRPGRKTFEEYGGDAPSVYSNQMPQHPPMYYWTTGTALRVERAVSPDSHPPLDREWNIVRLMNAAMVLPLPLVTWAAARRLRASATAATAAAIVPLAIPQVLHIGASINNDNLLILLCGVVAVPVAGVLRGDRRRTQAALIGTIAGLALLTKSFALALLPWIALAYGYQAWRERDRWKRSIGCLLIAAAAMVVVGGWWPARNVWRGDGPYPSILTPATGGPTEAVSDPIVWSRQFVTNVVQRFWGDFGFFDAPMTQALVIVATVAVAVAAVLAFVPPPRKRKPDVTGPTRGQLAVFGSLLPVLVALLAIVAYDQRGMGGRTPWMQGRYLFGALVPLSIVVAIGLVRALTRWSPVAVLGAALVMQFDAARVGLRAWWAEPDASVTRSLDAIVRWSPWPAAVTYLVGVLALVCAIITMVTLLRAARAMDDGPHDAADPPPTRIESTANAVA
jgi:small subunit ribosomal protein S36